MSELRVAVDLMLKGYDVFRALSSQTGCDLVIIKQNKILRVEVRSGRQSKRGARMFWTKPKATKIAFDIFAVVLDDSIVYRPPLPQE
jgi:hypothetical protein